MYAVMNDGSAWRAINQETDLLPNESLSWTIPVLMPTLAQVQASQICMLNSACQAAIVGGVVSTALGASYIYPSAMTDQQNLAANVVSSLLPSLPAGWTTKQMCCDASGAWDYRPHTAAQIQQAGSDVKVAIEV